MNTQRPTDTSGAGTAQGSSTGAPGAPTGVQDTRSQYDPLRTGYNPSTGAGYSTASAGGPHQHHHQPASPSNSYDQTAGQDDRIQHAPSTAQRVKMEEEQEGDSTSSVASLFARKGEDVGRSVKGTIAGIHGAGESLRGTLNAAVDRAFGSPESAARNQEIASKGQREVKTGQLESERNR